MITSNFDRVYWFDWNSYFNFTARLRVFSKRSETPLTSHFVCLGWTVWNSELNFIQLIPFSCQLVMNNQNGVRFTQQAILSVWLECWCSISSKSPLGWAIPSWKCNEIQTKWHSERRKDGHTRERRSSYQRSLPDLYRVAFSYLFFVGSNLREKL